MLSPVTFVEQCLLYKCVATALNTSRINYYYPTDLGQQIVAATAATATARTHFHKINIIYNSICRINT